MYIIVDYILPSSKRIKNSNSKFAWTTNWKEKSNHVVLSIRNYLIIGPRRSWSPKPRQRDTQVGLSREQDSRPKSNSLHPTPRSSQKRNPNSSLTLRGKPINMPNTRYETQTELLCFETTFLSQTYLGKGVRSCRHLGEFFFILVILQRSWEHEEHSSVIGKKI